MSPISLRSPRAARTAAEPSINPDQDAHMTPLDKPLRREITIGDLPYTLVISADSLKLTPKGHRKGTEILWKDLVSGDAAIAAALNASDL
jgi:hypothetical protein